MTWIVAVAIAVVVTVAVRRRVRRHRQEAPVLTRAELVKRGWADDLERRR